MSDATTREAKAEDIRTRMLDAAERLLIASDDHDISTRAVCDAIGVAQAILSANVGVALSMLSQPGRYADPHLSHRVREAVFGACLTPETDAGPTPDNAMTVPALQLETQLKNPGISPLEPEETALLLK